MVAFPLLCMQSAVIYFAQSTFLRIALLRPSSIQDADNAEEQPHRVVLIEDIRPFLFSLSQPASSRWVVCLKLRVRVFSFACIHDKPCCQSDNIVSLCVCAWGLHAGYVPLKAVILAYLRPTCSPMVLRVFCFGSLWRCYSSFIAHSQRTGRVASVHGWSGAPSFRCFTFSEVHVRGLLRRIVR